MNLSRAAAPKLRGSGILERLISRTIRSNGSAENADRAINFTDWQWQQGVALYGLMRAYRATNDRRCVEFVRDWVDSHLRLGIRPKSINTTAPVLAMAELAETAGHPQGREVCEEYAKWCLKDAPRLSDGTFEHSCTENRYPLQVWADTLFMGCLFLAQWGKVSGEPKYVREAALQFERHHRHLSDPRTGLVFHAYLGDKRINQGVLWARGNGWYAAASSLLLDLIEPRSPEAAAIGGNLLRQLDGLMAAQSPEGGWHTVVPDPTTYLESSGTAAVAFALSRAFDRWGDARHGESARRAYAFLATAVNPEGELTLASGGTPVMGTAADYNAVPYAVTCFSQGLALLAFSQGPTAGR